MGRFNISSNFSKNPKLDFCIYAKGYHNAAVILINDFTNGEHHGDYCGYPIVFLFRHSLELYLKGIIYNAVNLANYQNIKQIDDKLYIQHGLVALEAICTKLLDKIIPNDPDIKKLCNNLHEICKKIEGLDKGSYSYRYPIDTSDNPSTPPNQIIEIKSFGKELDTILGQLDILEFGIDLATDNISEINGILNDLT